MLDSSKESLDPVPPYPVGRMRELCEPPYGKSLFGEYHTPMPRNYNRYEIYDQHSSPKCIGLSYGKLAGSLT